MFMVLSMLCQENMPLAVIMFAVLAAFQRRQLKWIITPVVIGGLYLLIALLALSYFNNNTVQFIAIYNHLGNTPLGIIFNILKHPSILLKTLIRKECFMYLFQIFLPLSFVPFFSPVELIPALPFFLQHMLSNRYSDLTIFYHYTAEIIPFIFISLIYGIKSLLYDRRLAQRQKFLKTALLSVLFISNLWFGPHFMVFPELNHKYKKDYLDRYKEEFIKEVPKGASVIATFEFLSHLSHRKFLYSFHHVYSGFYTLSNKEYHVPGNIEYALIDFNDFLTFEEFFTPYGYRNIQGFLSEGNWQVEGFIENIVLFKKGITPRYALCKMIEDPDREIQNKTLINVAGDIALIGYNMGSPDKRGVLDITFYWKCLRPAKKDINVFLDIVDKNGRLMMRKIHPICYRIFPTNSWKEGEIFKEQFRIQVPSFYRGGREQLKIGFFDYLQKRICKIEGPADNSGRVFLTEAK
jgi:hypothetical protein